MSDKVNIRLLATGVPGLSSSSSSNPRRSIDRFASSISPKSSKAGTSSRC